MTWPAKLFFKDSNVQDNSIFVTTTDWDLPEISFWDYEGLHSINLCRCIMENLLTVLCIINSFVWNKGEKLLYSFSFW